MKPNLATHLFTEKAVPKTTIEKKAIAIFEKFSRLGYPPIGDFNLGDLEDEILALLADAQQQLDEEKKWAKHWAHEATVHKKEKEILEGRLQRIRMKLQQWLPKDPLAIELKETLLAVVWEADP